MSNLKKVAILGAGVMGTGIAQAFAMKGHEVMIINVYKDAETAHPIEVMTSNLEVLCENGVFEKENIPEVIGRVSRTSSLEEAAQFADIIFECIVEKLETKQEYFAKLDELCPESTILCSNTSAISITEIAETSVHKERIIGTHFWNPAYLIPLVEVIKTKYVSDEVVNETYRILEEAGRSPVIVQKDVPGFLANRLQHALFREAISIVEKGIATPEVSTENRMRVLRLLENLCLGAAAVGYRTESMHGAGSPQAQRIMISRQSNLQSKKEMAKAICGIK